MVRAKYLMTVLVIATSLTVHAGDSGLQAPESPLTAAGAGDAAAMAAGQISAAVMNGQAALQTPEGREFLTEAKGAKQAMWTAAKLSADEARLTDIEAAQIIRTKNGETQVVLQDGSAMVGYIAGYYLLRKIFPGHGLIGWAVKVGGGVTLAYVFYHKTGNYITMRGSDAKALEMDLSQKIQNYKAELAATQAGRLVTGY